MAGGPAAPPALLDLLPLEGDGLAAPLQPAALGAGDDPDDSDGTTDDDSSDPGIVMDDDQVQRLLRAARPSRKLSLFSSGLGAEWRTWRANAEIIIGMNGWSNARARQEIASSIEGKAKENTYHFPINDALIPPGPGAGAAAVADAADYRLLLDTYQGVFLPASASDTMMVAFRAARQKEDEDIMSFHSRVRSLFTQAYPAVPNDELNNSRDCIHRFILGLADPQVKRDTWKAKPRTYQAALDEAQDNQSGDSVLQDEEASKRIAHLGPEAEKAAVTPPAVNYAGAPVTDKDCWKCGITGHLAFRCRAPDRPVSRWARPPSYRGGPPPPRGGRGGGRGGPFRGGVGGRRGSTFGRRDSRGARRGRGATTRGDPDILRRINNLAQAAAEAAAAAQQAQGGELSYEAEEEEEDIDYGQAYGDSLSGN